MAAKFCSCCVQYKRSTYISRVFLKFSGAFPDVTKWCSARQAAFDLAKSLEYRNAWNLWQNVCVGQYWNSLDVPRVLSEAGRFSHLRSALGQSLRLSNKFIVFTVKGLLQRVTCFKKPRHSCHGRSSSLTKHNFKVCNFSQREGWLGVIMTMTIFHSIPQCVTNYKFRYSAMFCNLRGKETFWPIQ